MGLQVIKTPILKSALPQITQWMFGDMIKAMVDIEKERMAIDMELHADGETLHHSHCQSSHSAIMNPHHPTLAAGRWQKFSLAEQLGNIGSEVGRAARWQGEDPKRFESACERALELIDFTLGDPRWKGRLKEIGRLREVFCDACYGNSSYQTSLEDLNAYLLHFAIFARSNL